MRSRQRLRGWLPGLIAVGLSAALMSNCGALAPSASMSAAGQAVTTTQRVTDQNGETVAAAAPTATAAMSRQISAIGPGSVSARPDQAIVSVGAQSRATTAKAAHDLNNQAMQGVVEAIKAMGIPERAIQTGGIALYPTTDETNAITGYTATNNVAVTLDNSVQAGAVLDTAVRAGANMAGNVQFSMKDPAALRDQALTAAIDDAKAKASVLARASGLTLTDIISVAESGVGEPALSIPGGKGGGSSATAIGPGEVTVTAHVTVTFEASSP